MHVAVAACTLPAPPRASPFLKQRQRRPNSITKLRNRAMRPYVNDTSSRKRMACELLLPSPRQRPSDKLERIRTSCAARAGQKAPSSRNDLVKRGVAPQHGARRGGQMDGDGDCAAHDNAAPIGAHASIPTLDDGFPK